MENLTLYSMLIAILICIAGIVFFELSKPKEELMLAMVVLCVAASIGRFAFALIPQVQPATVLVIIAGYYLGSRYGFVCGCLVALVSNISLGHGPWTPFQMLGWGIVAFIGGLLPHTKNQYINLISLGIYSFFAAFLFSLVTDLLTVTYLGSNITLVSAISIFAIGIAFNISHAIGNVIFVIFLVPLLHRKLTRIKAR